MSRSFHSFRAFSRWIERLPRVAKLDSAITHSAPIASEKAGGADIIFSKVRLVYPTRPERPAIHELDLHIRSGEKVAFCGPSGGGKSSVLALLARFYESSRGVITVDGEDIRSAELADHYERISLVSQDAVLYEGTVRFLL
jgi:ATP-binding cassette subfamily B (MDR/TAP) protein 1